MQIYAGFIKRQGQDHITDYLVCFSEVRAAQSYRISLLLDAPEPVKITHPQYT